MRRGKLIALVIISLVLTLSLGYGLAAAQEKQVTTITFYNEFVVGPEREAIDLLMNLFSKAHPEVKIEPSYFENVQMEVKMKTAFAGGNPPDLSDHSCREPLWRFVRENVMADISDWMNKNKDRLILQKGAEDVRYDGKYWGVPLNLYHGSILWYNKDLLDKLSIDPTTFQYWSDVLNACEKLKANGYIPIAYGNQEGWNGAHWVGHFLTRIMGTEPSLELYCGLRDWTAPEVVKGFELYDELNKKGYFNEGAVALDYPTAYSVFFQGNAGFFQTGNWFIAHSKNAKPNFEIGVIPLPAIEGYAGKSTDAVVDILGLAISKTTKEREEAALKFIDFITQPEIYYQFVKTSYLAPAWNLGEYSEQITDPMQKNQLKILFDSKAAVSFGDTAVPMSIVTDLFRPLTQGILTNEITPQEAAKKMQERYIKDNIKLPLHP